jgi:site-specific recombinase XerD
MRPALPVLVERYLKERESAQAPGTIVGDRYALSVLLAFLGPGEELTRDRAQAYARHVEGLRSRRGRPLAPATQADLLCRARTFLHWLALRRHALEDLGALIAGRKVTRLPRPLGEAEVLALIEAAGRAPIVGRRNRAIVELLYGTGLRRAELLRLRPEDVDLYERLVHVLLGKRKKDRVVPLGERARLALLDYLRYERSPMGGPLFLTRDGQAMSRGALSAMLARLGQAAGLAGPVHPHRLRHSYATHLVRHGAPLPAVQQLLGHASIASTEVYLGVEVSDLRRMLEKSHPRERAKR